MGIIARCYGDKLGDNSPLLRGGELGGIFPTLLRGRQVFVQFFKNANSLVNTYQVKKIYLYGYGTGHKMQ